jgi:hypothetical protein
MKSLVRHPSFNWILGVIVAYCLLILSDTAAAAVVGSVQSRPNPETGKSDSITLHSEQGPICPVNSRRAVYFVSKDGSTVEGCYVVVNGTVHLGFIDGDTGGLPVEQFTWVPGNRPSVAPEIPGVGPGRDTKGTPKRKSPLVMDRGGAKDANWM